MDNIKEKYLIKGDIQSKATGRKVITSLISLYLDLKFFIIWSF